MKDPVFHDVADYQVLLLGGKIATLNVRLNRN